MKIVRIEDVVGTEREVHGPGWKSRHILLKKDGMGFSMHETIIPAGAELNLWYKHHLEAVYCVGGNGSILNKATGETHEIVDGTLYALDKHDQHTLLGGTEDMRLVCTFNPPVTGQEVHDEDGAYVLDDGVSQKAPSRRFGMRPHQPPGPMGSGEAVRVMFRPRASLVSPLR